ncbi:MAG: 23S rRNA (uracil(1939)-C(5))-methyltransferase RlmD [Ruminococcaceae bacterium]|nr:23S rRNA (uracil(1939)-C(5))-methyltransferase RlmD [Oscillospiraceae bacterium]
MPLAKNDIITLEITALTNEGSGVGHYKEDISDGRGMAVFVPMTAVGDVISCRVVKVLRSYAYGRVEGILTASPDRAEDGCPVYAKCGGCCFRHISYEAELRAKQGFVQDAFMRLGGLSPEFLPIQGSESPEGYRNKLQMPVSKQDGRTVCGFYSERSHRVVPVEKCALQPELFAEITRFVTEQADRLRISVYNEEKHEGVLRHIYLRRGHYSGEVCLCLVARRKVPEFERLAKAAAERFPEITGVVLNINRDRTNVILGEEEQVLFGRAEIKDTMCGVNVEISPKSFYQVNTPAAEALYRQAAEFAQPEGKLLLDLYCGAGTIGLSMAGKARRLIGAEIVPQAVENARENAERNSVKNAEFICADAGQAAQQLERSGERPDVIILDPPRKGCSEDTLTACAGMQPERIVMISCNAATAARDCKRLAELGYTAAVVRPFDLFPRTSHVECVVLINKNNV